MSQPTHPLFSQSQPPVPARPGLPPEEMREWINLKLAALGQPVWGDATEYPLLRLCQPLLHGYRERARNLKTQLSPVDQRIQDFLKRHFTDLADEIPALPGESLVLEVAGMGTELSIPPDRDEYVSPLTRSYRIAQGVLHNPVNDRRTTAGVFHVCEGPIPVPRDKIPVPRVTYLRLLKAALRPPDDLLEVPYTASQEKRARCLVSLLLRPLVVPSVPGISRPKRMETRFFAPGSLVSNLDFVERIFGNGGDPFLPENNAALDPEGWSGHTGCVILAPHLTRQNKKELGLPHIDEATEWQRETGMCWEKEDEVYNHGQPFKVTCRDASGVMVTLIADNYFGYCKKEVKTQISFACNLFGLAEEEHAGGTYAFPSYDLGEEFATGTHIPMVNHTFEEGKKILAEIADYQPEGYATDKQFSNILYLPEQAEVNLHDLRIEWNDSKGDEVTLPLQPGQTYVYPSGYKVEMIKPGSGRRWRLIGTVAEPTFCHKPCTVSGGGKSEISKPISDAILHGSTFVNDFEDDFRQVMEILNRDYSNRFLNPPTNAEYQKKGARPILSAARSIGSVIKLLTPSREYTPEYNQWLEAIPQHIRELVFTIKRFYKPAWGDDWIERFSVDWVNGQGGNELKYRGQKILSSFLRLGFTPQGNWRTFGLRKDFYPARKVQAEDDISVSLTLPGTRFDHLNPRYTQHSFKFVENCERCFFQRPDEAVIRGYDKQTEIDFSKPGNFLSNFEPLKRDEIQAMKADVLRFEQFTTPVRRFLENFLNSDKPEFTACSANPRLVNGKPTKNPRYLQRRTDWEMPRELYLAEVGLRLYRRVGWAEPLSLPVNAVLPGRRNNPPDRELGIPPLATHNPIHYLELPEVFIEFITSLTGKSPSTTGAGSEGALTKGPFNALPAIVDLNNALVSAILTNQETFITSAGTVGPHCRFDHDISLIIPEVWSRMTPEERDPQYLIKNELLERCGDFVHEGKTYEGNRLGWRINENFVNAFFGRVFNNPNAVFPPEVLRPEDQDPAIFAESLQIMVDTSRMIAENYFEDGTIEGACPPLRALLHIMRDGEYEGMTLQSPELRNMFTLEYLKDADWYKARLQCHVQIRLQHLQYQQKQIQEVRENPVFGDITESFDLNARLQRVEQEIKHFQNKDAWKEFEGTLGTDPWLHNPK